VRATTEHGNSLLFAYPPISVSEHPAVCGQTTTFARGFAAAFQQDISRYELIVVTSQELRRMVPVYGTRRPGHELVSGFPAAPREPDEQLREHLLQLLPADINPFSRYVPLMDHIPQWFPALLDDDRLLQDLRQKPENDDTIAAYLAEHTTNPEETVTILSLRATRKRAPPSAR
jgi:hypothetical protein